MERNITLLVLCLLAAACHHRPVTVRSKGTHGETVYKSITAAGTGLQLPDGSEIWLYDSSIIRVPEAFNSSSRDLFLEGEAEFIIKAGGMLPFIVHTRALLTRVESVGAIFKIDGYRDHAGEEVDLLKGVLNVSKAYHSNPENATETLNAGDMLMINTDIDLMEKEQMDSTEMKSWQGMVKKSGIIK